MSLARYNSDGVAEVSDFDAGSVRIYKRRSFPVAVFAGAFFFISIGLFAAVDLHLAIVVGSALAIFGCVPLALDFRRRISISEKGFEYKWRSGRVTRINVADVEKTDEISMPYMMFPGTVTYVPGLRVVLTAGEVRVFPLDFPDREEILGRIGAIVLKAKSSREPAQIGP